MWKNRLAWALLILGALVYYLFENNTGTRALLCASVLLPLASGLLLLLPRYSVTMELQAPEKQEKGQAAKGRLLLRNEGRFPILRASCRLEIHNRLTEERVVLSVPGAIRGRDSAAADFSFQAAHYGRLELCASEERLYDLLGLFSRRLPGECTAVCSVAPKAQPLRVSLAENADFLQDSLRYSSDRPGYDASETFRIRDYVPGDPVRQIHWKLSQKTDKLLVRELGLPIVDRMLLLLEHTELTPGQCPPDTLDKLLELLASLSEELLAAGISHVVAWQRRPEGVLEAASLNSPEDLSSLWERLLSSPGGQSSQTAAGCFLREHPRCDYAHVAVLTPYPLPDIGELCSGNRVTQLLPAGEAGLLENWDGGSAVTGWTEEALEKGELTLVL